mmetsp:Transcript_45968/g.133174  ORF Transcript_45968/g.133174 Transcript_45968/m.133174 type:complete len:259 (+) Transcript_45968:752-1528(+)
MTHGAELSALWKTRRTARSDSPTYLFSSSGPLIAMKFAPLAFAVALARSVFPHPGGPNRSTPEGVVKPSCLKSSALRMGSQIAASRSARTSCRAPTSCQLTSGMVAKPSRRADGCTFPTATRKSAMVTARGAISAEVYGTGLPLSSSASPPALNVPRSLKARLTAPSAASFVSAERSAPTKPGVRRASSGRSRSSARRIPRVILPRMWPRAASSGIPMAISRSKRPARRSAGSRASGLFVAPRTTTCVLCSSSMQVRS